METWSKVGIDNLEKLGQQFKACHLHLNKTLFDIAQQIGLSELTVNNFEWVKNP